MHGSNSLLHLAAVLTLAAQEPRTPSSGPTFAPTFVPTFGTTVIVPGGLTGNIYFIPQVNSLPNLSKLKPVGKIYTNVLNVPLTEFSEGFPGVTDRFEWFAIEYTGRFYVSNPGKYRFRLFSDDGSKLFIDGKPVINNDGVGWLESEGAVNLAGGIHDIRVPYFQGPRYHLALILSVRRPGDPNYRIFDTDDYAPPSEFQDWKYAIPTDWKSTTPDTPVASNPPPLAERQDVIQRASIKAAAYNANLPDFVCTEVLDRSENRSGRGWKPKDVLTVQLNYASRKEHHKLIAQNGVPTAATFAALKGALSEGEFSSILADIFRPETAKFEWSHQELLHSRNVYVFSYRIAQEKSGYAIQYSGTPVGASRNIFVAYHGFVYIDQATGDVLRLTRIAELPDAFPIREAHTTVDYSVTTVAGRSYLLPSVAQVNLNTSSLKTSNEVRFLDYRKFEADATITFPDKP
jgi:hypothetical protein